MCYWLKFLQQQNMSKIKAWVEPTNGNGGNVNKNEVHVSHIRIFDCKILVCNQNVERSKLNLQAFERTFVKYDENSMTYTCYNLKKKKIMFNKDVKFNEFSTIKHETWSTTNWSSYKII